MNHESPFNPNRFNSIDRNWLFLPNYLCLLYDIGCYSHPTEPVKRLRLVCRSIYWAKPSLAWFKQIAHSPFLSELIKREKNLAEKLHRQILRVDYKIDKRLQILTGHYAEMQQLLAPSRIEHALLNGGLQLAQIDIDAQHSFVLTLNCSSYPGKEGEKSIRLFDINGHELTRLSFSILPDPDGKLIYIGGLQGASCENSRQLVAQASKACYGLAPKRIVMEALFALAKQLAVKRILGVSDQKHISNCKPSKHFKYNEHWAEFNAHLSPEGDYVLPLTPQHKDYAATPRKRRAKYRRQHAILEHVNSASLAALAE